MKKITNGILLIFLTCFSFFYTDKVINMINKKDPLMMEISLVKSNYEVLPVNAVIDEDTIIPGINGKEIDVNKSYENMKLSGVFRETALIFKDLYPSDSMKDNINKYVVKGNSSKKDVTLIYILNKNYIAKVRTIENLTIFIDHKDLNISNMNSLGGKEIYTYGNNGLYSDEVLTSDNALINRLSNNKSKYCLVKNKDDNVLEVCNKNDMYVVLPNIIGGYYEIKNKLSNGSIILLDNLNEIDSIIKYIRGKGYNIVSLDSLLRE